MYSAETIANWFLINIDRESGDSITHLKLQKLLYYAQAWYMVLTENEAEPILFEEKIEAWTHGPVVREVYNKYSEMRYDSIPRPDDNVVLDEETAQNKTYGEVADNAKVINYSFVNPLLNNWVDQWNRIVNR